MAIEVYRHPTDVPIDHAMLVWNRGEGVGVVPHPDRGGISRRFRSSAGACWGSWHELDAEPRLLLLMIEAWHLAAFHMIPAEHVHQALLCIPEYRDTLAFDCLPHEYRHERDDEAPSRRR